jgi:hypothetical protein
LSLLEQTPEYVANSKKHRVKGPIVATPEHPHTRFDLLITLAPVHEDADSYEHMEAVALSNTVVLETAISDMCEEAVGDWHAPSNPQFAHLASRPNTSSTCQSAFRYEQFGFGFIKAASNCTVELIDFQSEPSI